MRSPHTTTREGPWGNQHPAQPISRIQIIFFLKGLKKKNGSECPWFKKFHLVEVEIESWTEWVQETGKKPINKESTEMSKWERQGCELCTRTHTYTHIQLVQPGPKHPGKNCTWLLALTEVPPMGLCWVLLDMPPFSYFSAVVNPNSFSFQTNLRPRVWGD